MLYVALLAYEKKVYVDLIRSYMSNQLTFFIVSCKMEYVQYFMDG